MQDAGKGGAKEEGEKAENQRSEIRDQQNSFQSKNRRNRCRSAGMTEDRKRY